MPPIENLTATSVNSKVYHKAPQNKIKCGALLGGFADTFLFVIRNYMNTQMNLNILDLSNKHADFTSALYLKLSSLGWYMPMISETAFVFDINLLLEQNKIHSVDKKMTQFIETTIATYKKHIKRKLPKRNKILDQVFKAHKQKLYYLTIPAIYGQLDGICEEHTGYRLFKTQKGSPVIAAFIKSFNKEFLLKYFGAISNTNEQNRIQDKSNISGSNRHDILHGTSKDYGTRVNSCKALSLLFFMIDFLHFVKE